LITVFRTASQSLAVRSTFLEIGKQRSRVWERMSHPPEVVWYGERVKVSFGFRMANFGRTMPTGRVSFTSALPAKKSHRWLRAISSP